MNDPKHCPLWNRCTASQWGHSPDSTLSAQTLDEQVLSVGCELGREQNQTLLVGLAAAEDTSQREWRTTLPSKEVRDSPLLCCLLQLALSNISIPEKLEICNQKSPVKVFTLETPPDISTHLQYIQVIPKHGPLHLFRSCFLVCN
jgi:hypothetical protein